MTFRSENVDPHAVLGIGLGATAAEARSAWRRLAKFAHPDAGGDVERMQALNAALQAVLTGLPTTSGEFSVNVLPVVACEALLVAVATLGEVVDADEPYRIEGFLAEPAPCFVVLDLVPEAGGSIVNVTVAAAEDAKPPSAGDVVDALTAVLP